MTRSWRLTERGKRAVLLLLLLAVLALLWATNGDYQACIAAGYGPDVC